MEIPCPGEKYPVHVKEHTILFIKNRVLPDVVFYTGLFIFCSNNFERLVKIFIGLSGNAFRQQLLKLATVCSCTKYFFKIPVISQTT